MAEQEAWRKARGALGRGRRAFRARLLTPVLLGVRSFRETILNALAARGHLVFCRLPEGSFFVDPSDRVIGSWLMWHGRWQLEEIDQAVGLLAAAGRLPAEAVFVDVGANIGTHTVYAMRGGRFSRGVAFEPEPKNADLLTMNIVANGLREQVTVVAKALGASDGTATLNLHPRNKGAHAIGLHPSFDGMESVRVPVTRLDTALGSLGIGTERIGLIWIDVEGAELAVVQGLGDLLGRVPLAIEYAPERMTPPDAAALRALLVERYKVWHRLGGEGGKDTNEGFAQPMEALARVTSITDILVF